MSFASSEAAVSHQNARPSRCRVSLTRCRVPSEREVNFNWSQRLPPGCETQYHLSCSIADFHPLCPECARASSPGVLSRCSRVQATLSDAGKPAVTFRHTRHSRPSWKGAAEPSPKSLQRAPLAGTSRDAHPAESALKRQTAGPEMRLQTSLEHRLRVRLPLRPCLSSLSFIKSKPRAGSKED